MSSEDIDMLFKPAEKVSEGTDWLAMVDKIDKLISKPVIRELIQNIFQKNIKAVNDDGYVPSQENRSLPINNSKSPSETKKGVKIHKLSAEDLYNYMITVLGLVLSQEGDKVTVKEMLDDLNNKKAETIKIIDKML